MDFKIIFTENIGPLYLYNFDVHQIYILWLYIFEKFNLKRVYHLFSIYSITFVIVKVIIFNFSLNLLNEFKIIFSEQIGQF